MLVNTGTFVAVVITFVVSYCISQNALDLIRLQIPRQRGQAPVGDGWDCLFQADRTLTGDNQEADELAQSRRR